MFERSDKTINTLSDLRASEPQVGNSKELLSVEIPHLTVQQLLLDVLDQVLDTYQRRGGSKGVHVMSIRA